MGFKSIPLKYSYDSNQDDLLWDFYVPTLSMSKMYDRISGFFSSSSLAISAKGLADFISNHGKMRLITCPRFSAADVKAIENATTSIGDVISKSFIEDFDSIETKFQRDHVAALGWMIANGYLEMKIAVLKKNGKILSESEINEHAIVHQKVGIMYDDEGNALSFSGSNNESATGWLENIEEFKVFKSW